jgi:hypothetical protein
MPKIWWIALGYLIRRWLLDQRTERRLVLCPSLSLLTGPRQPSAAPRCDYTLPSFYLPGAGARRSYLHPCDGLLICRKITRTPGHNYCEGHLKEAPALVWCGLSRERADIDSDFLRGVGMKMVEDITESYSVSVGHVPTRPRHAVVSTPLAAL